MKQFLYRIQPTRPGMLTEGQTGRESKIIRKHFEYLRKLTEDGIVFMAGRTLDANECTFGIVIFAADSEKQASELVQNDPAVKYGVMRAELYPFRVSLWSRKTPEGTDDGV